MSAHKPSKGVLLPEEVEQLAEKYQPAWAEPSSDAPDPPTIPRRPSGENARPSDTRAGAQNAPSSANGKGHSEMHRGDTRPNGQSPPSSAGGTRRGEARPNAPASPSPGDYAISVPPTALRPASHPGAALPRVMIANEATPEAAWAEAAAAQAARAKEAALRAATAETLSEVDEISIEFRPRRPRWVLVAAGVFLIGAPLVLLLFMRSRTADAPPSASRSARGEASASLGASPPVSAALQLPSAASPPSAATSELPANAPTAALTQSSSAAPVSPANRAPAGTATGPSSTSRQPTRTPHKAPPGSKSSGIVRELPF